MSIYLSELYQIILAIAGLTVFAILSFRKIDWGIYLVILSLPLYLLRLKIWFIPVSILELEIYILFVMYLYRSRLMLISTLKNADKEWLVPILLIFLGAMLSTIFSSDIESSAGILKEWFLVPIFLLIVLIGRYDLVRKISQKEEKISRSRNTLISTLKYAENNEQFIKNILVTLGISGFLVAVVSLVYLLRGDLTFDGRLRAFYLSPNHLAMYLAPSFIIALCFIFFFRDRSNKLLWLISAFLMGIPLYFSHSLGAWFSLFVSLAIYFVYYYRYYCYLNKDTVHYRRSPIMYSIIFLTIVLLLAAFIFIQINNNTKIFGERSSLASRLMIWQSGFEMIKNPVEGPAPYGISRQIFGIGSGMFEKFYLAYQKFFPPYLEWAVPQPHNLFLAFYLQTGILGFFGFIWLLILFFRTGFNCINIRRSTPILIFPLKEGEEIGGRDKKLPITYYLLPITLVSIMIYVLIHGLVDTTYWKNDLAVMFWIIIGLMIIRYQKLKTCGERSRTIKN